MSENKELIPKDTDDSLDTLLENMKLTQPEDLDELIEKRVNRRIRQIVLKVLAVILIPVIMIRMVISPLMNAMNINPDQMNRDFETDESGNSAAFLGFTEVTICIHVLSSPLISNSQFKIHNYH